MLFKKAERSRVYLKIGFSAPSGCGKTYSALLTAYGLCGDWSKIALIDTENGSGELYSSLGEYSVCALRPPFTPDKYIEAINLAADNGFSVLIIDSLSHAWNGEGGLLEMQDKAARASKSGNSYTAWRDITPLHNKLVNTILQSQIDIIVTVRAKSDYVINQDGGKTTIKKIGLAPIFREGLEFELTTFFDLSIDHIATASKDRTGQFDGKNFIPTAETGKIFNAWRNSGVEPVKSAKAEDKPFPEQATPSADQIAILKKKRGAEIRDLIAIYKVDEKTAAMEIKKYGDNVSELTEQQYIEVLQKIKENKL